MKSHIFAFLLCLICTVNASLAGGIGSINNAQIMAEYPAAVDAQRKIIGLRAELQKKIQSLQQSATKDLEAASSDKEKNTIKQSVQSKFEAERARYESLVQNLTKEIDDKIQDAINAVAKRKGLDAVMSNASIYYGNVDITKDVLNELK